MTSPPRKPAKQSSGWGGLLQQAVLSVESRLDTILADEDQPTTKSTSSGKTQENIGQASTNISRSSSAARTNDRLQERLARAMAKKKSEGRNDSPSSNMDPVSRIGTPNDKLSDETRGESTERTSVGHRTSLEVPRIDVEDARSSMSTTSDAPENEQEGPANLRASFENHSRAAIMSQSSTPSRLSTEEGSLDQVPDVLVNGAKAAEDVVPPEEMYTYLEKIDALQAKLQYLTKEAALSAHGAAATAKAGSLEKKLLEKDERIALLMDEGQKLSKTEMRHLMVIKKLRSQAAESARSQTTIKARAEKAEVSLSSAEQRTARAEAAMRRAEENLAVSLNADRDAEALKKERDALMSTVADIRTQLAYATRKADEATSKAQIDAVGKEKKEILDLQDDLTSAKVEREISEEKLRREIRDLKEVLEREKERSSSLEMERRAEQSLFESKMESLRNRAEEASSNRVGDSQAKLLRQMETLQNQYAVASENWQGIEGSLLARIANVERERDSLEHHESEMRKRIREATQKARSAERECETSRAAMYQVEQSLSEQNGEIQQLRRSLKSAEDSLENVRKDLEAQQYKFEMDLSRRIEEEKSKLKEHVSTQSSTIHRTGSPIGSMRKTSAFGLGIEHMGTGAPLAPDRNQSRRSSILPHLFRNSNTPPQQNSSASFHLPINETVPETPASQIIDQDEYFPEPPTPLSQSAYRGVSDMISVSTVGAGPSVQLVERMSASVRRLESEKAASKDELARLTAQRDESRKEVVSLMREVEQKRATEDKIKALEEELRLVNQRHQTTLEMLGEKSELVDELRADVADVKQMYRDLVDSTMK